MHNAQCRSKGQWAPATRGVPARRQGQFSRGIILLLKDFLHVQQGQISQDIGSSPKSLHVSRGEIMKPGHGFFTQVPARQQGRNQ